MRGQLDGVEPARRALRRTLRANSQVVIEGWSGSGIGGDERRLDPSLLGDW